jgi:D-alanyl-lipoteichoic acid acyltransferase DltB (MBOAT superfamily)
MLFNSLSFVIFFPVVTALYFALPHRARPPMLLVASCVFYMAFIPAYILILAGTIVVDYFAGIFLERATGHRRRLLLLASLFANIGVLAVFKYYNFLIGNLNGAFALAGTGAALPFLKIALPIGLSFHTFQAMSYTIEVYRGKQAAERNFITYALYVMFYPQLVAGPIERPQNLLPQLHAEHSFDPEGVARGLERMLWGLFKKMVVADRLDAAVNAVYGEPTAYSGAPLWIATLFFSVQIYCDFSGYSDIAIGAARVMGIKLMENFDRPYFARSVPEFWRRWHISLSSWFRDYVFFPAGGMRDSFLRRALAIVVVFLLSGLWHGAAWTFVAWGALHAVYQVAALAWRTFFERFKRLDPGRHLPRGFWSLCRGLFTFSLVSFAWIFFRAESLSDAWHVVTHLFGPSWGPSYKPFWLHIDAVVACSAVGVLFMTEIFAKGRPLEALARQPRWLRWSATYLTAFAILALEPETKVQFIYFQF